MSNSESNLSEHHSSAETHRRMQNSSTLNRRYVRRPGLMRDVPITSTAKRQADDLKRRQELAAKINRERLAALKKKLTDKKQALTTPKDTVSRAEQLAAKDANVFMKKPQSTPMKSQPQPSMNERKTAAIKSALASVSTMDTRNKSKRTFKTRRSFSPAKIILAFSCAIVAVAAVGYVVSVNTPDISVRVAAMQTGIDATYPAHTPRGFSLSSVTSEDGKVSMTFSKSAKESFTLTEERSSWNSSALESNYIKDTFSDNYSVITEQGITIFVSGSNAAWINGGILYKLTTTSIQLTKKQIKAIATSL